MIFVMLISLYTSRRILSLLGIEDYGIFSAVGGIISLLGFLNNSLSVATQRFLTYALGENDLQKYNKVFSTALTIHCLLAVILFVIIEIVGVWFLNYKMNIPTNRLNAANWVFQTSVVSLIIGVLQTPYSASITAHERLDVFAYVGVTEACVKLGAVMSLSFFDFDKLKLYGLIILMIHFATYEVYRLVCRSLYKECHFKWIFDIELLKSLTSFTGWNLFGALAWILKDHGSNILMNIFGGPAVNAARGVSSQISTSVTNLVNGFQTAVNPQLTKTYASQNKEEMYILLCRSSKISYFLLFALVLPLSIEMEAVMNIWLVDVPKFSVMFTRLILFESLINTISGPVITCLMATGQIKWYQLCVGSAMLLYIPISFFLLHIGFHISTPLFVSIFLMLFALAGRLLFLRYNTGVPIISYLKEVLLPIVKVSILAIPFPLFCYVSIYNSILRLMLVAVTSLLSVLLVAFFVGFNIEEQTLVKEYIYTFIKRKWKDRLA